MSDEVQFSRGLFADRSRLGNILTILAGLFFYIVCMLLPLVGPAGRTTEHYGLNFVTFVAVLLVASACAMGGLIVKLRTRKEDQSPFPYITAGLASVYLLLLVNLLAGQVSK